MFKVYFTGKDNLPYSKDHLVMVDALRHCQMLRNDGYSFVTMISENPNSVGNPGVDSVQDGKLPSGEVYDWMKRRTQ